MRVLRIWHAAVLSEYRKKIKAIADIQDINLTLLIPERWHEAGSLVFYQHEPHIDEGYLIKTANVLFQNNIRKYIFLNRLFQLMRDFKPNVIDIEEEPSALVTAQVLWYREILNLNCSVIFHTAHNLPTVPKPLFEKVQRYVLKCANGAIVRNTDAKNILETQGFHKPITISGNGLDLSHFKSQTDSDLIYKYSLKGKTVLGYVGKLKPDKGLMTLLKAFKALREPSLILLIVGTGGFQTDLERFVQENGLKSHVIFTGHQSQDILPKLYSLMDILVIPSRTSPKWKESFGRVIIEAMACGVPVVGSSSGSIPETIHHAGLIFKEESHEDLTEKIRTILHNPQLKLELKEKGLIHSKKFSWQALAQISYQAYKDVLHAHH